MAYLAVRGSGAVNGLSHLHGIVSRQLFALLFPRWPQPEVPIGSVTNGIHTPTGDSAAADELWTQACGKDRWLGTMDALEKDIRGASDAALWQLRTSARQSLVEYARERLSTQLAASGAPSEAVNEAKHLFDPKALTLGFARRFATYKRSNLLLHDRKRLLRLLSDPQRPVQLIMAGKAHPADQAGQALIQEWILFIRQQEVRAHVIFLSDYDMLLTEHLVQGVDVWINTPRRPWEACGTSGMKVLVNGGINLSELDGWWAEAFTPEVGWALGDEMDHGRDSARDAVEADALYGLLEQAVIPEFYDRRETGMPIAWIKRMRESMAPCARAEVGLVALWQRPGEHTAGRARDRSRALSERHRSECGTSSTVRGCRERPGLRRGNDADRSGPRFLEPARLSRHAALGALDWRLYGASPSDTCGCVSAARVRTNCMAALSLRRNATMHGVTSEWRRRPIISPPSAVSNLDTRRRIGRSRSCRPTRSMREENCEIIANSGTLGIPPPDDRDRRMAALVLQYAERCRSKCEMLRLADRQLDPSRGERRANLAVGEKRDIP
jgi:hypothetical protein